MVRFSNSENFDKEFRKNRYFEALNHNRKAQKCNFEDQNGNFTTAVYFVFDTVYVGPVPEGR
jgi:hypothetical protein